MCHDGCRIARVLTFGCRMVVILLGHVFSFAFLPLGAFNRLQRRSWLCVQRLLYIFFCLFVS